MEKLVLTTFDWVPEGPRGFVRDMRLRWACEEAELSYQVESTPFKDRGEQHFQHQPFGQVPWLTDGDISIFESGAGLLHLAQKSENLMPRDPVGEAQTLQWTIAALNSILHRRADRPARRRPQPDQQEVSGEPDKVVSLARSPTHDRRVNRVAEPL